MRRYYKNQNKEPLSWTAAGDLGSYNWYGLAWGGSKFVALGSSGYVSTSSDGATWSTATQKLSDRSWRGLAWDGSKFVALSSTGYIATSMGGTTWIKDDESYLGSGNWYDLAWNGSKFVALGSNGYISTSTDGTTWNSPIYVSNLGDSASNWQSIAWDGFKFVALNTQGYISTSTNGTTWSPAFQNSNLGNNSGNWRALAWDGSKFVTIGSYVPDSYTSGFSTSTDGISWSIPKFTFGGQTFDWYALTYGNNKFVALRNVGATLTSPKGSPYWIQPKLGENYSLGGPLFAVDASSVLNATNNAAYKAFDTTTTTFWSNVASTFPATLTMYNPTPLRVLNFHILNRSGGAYGISSYKINVSNDNIEYSTIKTGTNSSTASAAEWNIDLSSNTNFYKYYQIEAVAGTGNYAQIAECTITAIEQSIVPGTSSDYDYYIDVPEYKAVSDGTVRLYYKYQDSEWTQDILSDNNVAGGPLFAAISSSEYNATYLTWKAFDKGGDTSVSDTTGWQSAAGSSAWLGFYNPDPLKVTKFGLRNWASYAIRYTATSGSVEASTDGESWESLTTFTNTNTANSGIWYIDIPSNKQGYYKYYKINLQKDGQASYGIVVTELAITATKQTVGEGTSSDYDFYRDVPAVPKSVTGIIPVFKWTTAIQNSNLGSHSWARLTYGSTKFVALSTQGYISTSTDGTTWTTATQNSNLGDNSWFNITWDGSKFVALSSTGYVSTSTDGTTWVTATQVINSESSLGSWYGLTWDGSKFVALSTQGYISTSTDGTTWTTATYNSNLGVHNWCGLVWDGSKFVSLGSYGYISTSTDGATWTSATQNSNLGNNNWNCLAWGGSKFVALGQTGYVSTSTDGTTWTKATQNGDLGKNHAWYGLAWDGSKFVALGTYGHISPSYYENKNRYLSPYS